MIDRRLAAAVSAARAVPLAEARPPDSSSAYLLYYQGGLPLYQPVVAAQTPIYVGSAKNVRRRLGEHRSSIRAVRSLNVADFMARLIETPTHDAAVYAESRLITLYRPVWNLDELAGFGSKHQGLGRIAAQEPSPWDTIHPGRPWARPPEMRTRRRLLNAAQTAVSPAKEEANVDPERLGQQAEATL
ncbi:MAG: Eco29kI family restriction endonuclease [Actinomycetota bacterium]